MPDNENTPAVINHGGRISDMLFTHFEKLLIDYCFFSSCLPVTLLASSILKVDFASSLVK